MTPDVRAVCMRALGGVLEFLIEQGKIVGVRRAEGNHAGAPGNLAFLILPVNLKKPHGAERQRHGAFEQAIAREYQLREPLAEASTTGLPFFFAATLFLPLAAAV